MFISNTHVCLKSIKVWIHTTNDDNKMTWVEKVAFSLISCNLPSLTKIFQSPFPPLTIIYLIPHFSPQKHFIFSYKNLQIWNTWILHSILTLILLFHGATWGRGAPEVSPRRRVIPSDLLTIFPPLISVHHIL